MDKLKKLQLSLQKAGKLDRLAIYGEMMGILCLNKDMNIFSTYKQATDLFREYLEFDKRPSEVVSNHLTSVFHYIFQAIRNYAQGKYFKETYQDFLSFEQFLCGNDKLALIYSDLSYIFWRYNEMDNALKYGEMSLITLDKSDDIHHILPGRYSNVGYIYEVKGDYNRAEQYYEKGLNFGLSIHSDDVISLAYCGFGRLNLAKSNFKTAVKYFLEALKYFPDETTDNYIAVYTNLGVCYGKSGMYEEALHYLTRFLNDESKKCNPEMYLSLLINTANCYESLGQLEEAEKSLLEGIETARLLKNPQAVSGVYLNLGKLKLQQGAFLKALEYYRIGKEESAVSGNKSQDVVAEIGIGTAQSRIGDLDKAILSFKSALRKASKMELKTEMVECYRQLGEIYEKTGDYQSALENFREYSIYKQEIKDEQFEFDMKNIRESYQQQEQKDEKKYLLHTHSFISKELAELVKTPLIGHSKGIKEAFNKSIMAAEQGSVSVLITGESGTGKEIIAKIIHYAGRRNKEPFIAVNSVAFSNSLVESAFFGSEKGSFTGSTEKRIGYFEAVNKGTLFLDEIGDMPLAMQAKMLRVIDEHIIHRVGGTKDIAVDFQLISATNRNLQELTKINEFRFDLLNRINTLEIHIPPLRERKEDIPLLVDYYLFVFSRQNAKEKPMLSKEALQLLIDYHYPGNIRELMNILQRTVISTVNVILEPHDIIFPEKNRNETEPTASVFNNLNLAQCEEAVIREALQKSGNVQIQAAKLLGISPYALSRKLKKLNQRSTIQ